MFLSITHVINNLLRLAMVEKNKCPISGSLSSLRIPMSCVKKNERKIKNRRWKRNFQFLRGLKILSLVFLIIVILITKKK